MICSIYGNLNLPNLPSLISLSLTGLSGLSSQIPPSASPAPSPLLTYIMLSQVRQLTTNDGGFTSVRRQNQIPQNLSCLLVSQSKIGNRTGIWETDCLNWLLWHETQHVRLIKYHLTEKRCQWWSYTFSHKTMNTRENFWIVYCFVTNQMRDETATITAKLQHGLFTTWQRNFLPWLIFNFTILKYWNSSFSISAYV